LAIRKTGTKFQYQLLVTSTAESEDELDEEENAMLIHKDMKFHQPECGNEFIWENSDGYWQKFSFSTSNVNAHTAQFFETTILECMYELEFQKSHDEATSQQLEELKYDPAGNNKTLSISHPSSRPSGEIIARVTGDVYCYKMDTMTFELIPNGNSATADLISTGKDYEHLWYIDLSSGPFLCQPIDNSMNPYFSEEFNSFIWNYQDGKLTWISIISIFRKYQGYLLLVL
jgi:hypothetical protein